MRSDVPSSPAVEAARAVAQRLIDAGYRTLLAGGAVRDLLLGLTPHDADVATAAPPGVVIQLFPGAQEVGASFGVVIVPWDGVPIEVATFRREGPYLDGRRPSRVEFTDEVTDARRRDFTINGLFLDPVSGDILDYVGGRDDLATRTLRAIGNPEERFREDHLRLLRAVRFAAQLNFTIEPSTAQALRTLSSLADQVSAERVQGELRRLLTSRGAEVGLRILHESGLLGVVLPEVAAMDGVEQSPDFHPEGDVLTHTILLFRFLDSPSFELALAALLHDVGKPSTMEKTGERIRFPLHAKVGAEIGERICQRLRLSLDSTERVTELVAHHMQFIDVKKMRLSTLKRFLRMPHFEEHLALHFADCRASHGDLEFYEFARMRRDELGVEGISPARLVNGDDLKLLGFAEGPELGRALRALEDLQLEGVVQTKEEAIDHARKMRSTASNEG